MESLADLIEQSHHGTVPKLASALVAARPGEIKQSNLENVIRKLVRGDRSWWLSRRAWLDALATELAFESGAELLEALGAGPTSEPSRWVFDTFPGLRPLDLSTEAPFPGVPAELVQSDGPTRTLIWDARAGAGRTLVGRWLAARCGWMHVEVERVEDLAAVMPDRGRVFAVVRRPARSGPLQELRLPDDVRFVVALEILPDTYEWAERWRGPFEHVVDEPVVAPSDEIWAFGRHRIGVVTSGPASDWLGQLVDWVVSRAASTGALVRDRARLDRWLSAADVDAWFGTPGDVLELLAVVDEHGASVLPDEKASPAAALTRWLRVRGQRPAPGRVPTPVLTVKKFDAGAALIEAEVARLRDGLPAALNADTWRSLLPQLTLADIEADVVAKSPESLIAIMAKRGVGLFDGLVDAGVLRESGRGLVLHPTFAARWVRRAAVERLEAEGLQGTGVLLAHVDTVLSTLERWIAEVEAGRFERLEAAARTASIKTDVAVAVAVDGAVRVAALARVELPDELAARLLSVSSDVFASMFSDVPWLPFVHVAAPRAEAGPAAVFATWLLRARLGGRSGATAGGALFEGDGSEQARTRIVRALELGSRLPVSAALSDRWSEVIEAVGATTLTELGAAEGRAGTPWAGHAPSMLVDAFLGGETVPAEEVRRWAGVLRDLHGLRVRARSRGVDEAAVARMVWTALPTPKARDHGISRPDDLLSRSTLEDRRWFWSTLPPQRVDTDLWKFILHDEDAACSVSDAAWQAMAALLLSPDGGGERAVYHGEAFWKKIPDAVGIAAVLAGGVGGHRSALAAAVWQRWSDPLHQGVSAALASDNPPWDMLRSVAVVAPDTEINRLLDVIEGREDAHTGAVQWFLGQIAFQQRGQWRRAWRVLHQHVPPPPAGSRLASLRRFLGHA